MVEYDNKWGYVRADMLRMISDGEMQAYRDLIQGTPDPSVVNTVEPYQYNAQDLSCYGIVTQDKVNFRTVADKTSGKVIRKLNKNALCLVYGSEEVNGETWYRVGYDTNVGYINGQYFKQMTVGEAESFLNSTQYTEGLANNTASTGTSTSSTSVTTGTPSGIVSAEDQKVSEWVNPSSGSTVSYEPFDPFATPEPLGENGIANAEYLDSLVSKLQDGTLKQEDLETELQKFYKDAADPEGSVKAATAYIQEKTGVTATETPSESPEPMVTEEVTEYQQEQSSGGGAGWLIGIGLLAVAGGGGYYWYASTQKKRQAAQRMAQKKAAEQRKTQGNGKTGQTTGKQQGQPASAQNAAKVRTGNYTNSGSTTTAKPAQTDTAARKVVENPYGRYSKASTEEDVTYTASFKPDAEANKATRVRSNTAKHEAAEKPGTNDDPKA